MAGSHRLSGNQFHIVGRPQKMPADHNSGLMKRDRIAGIFTNVIESELWYNDQNTSI